MAASLALLLALPALGQPAGTILVSLDRTALVPYGALNVTYSVFDQAGGPVPGEGTLTVTLLNREHRENWTFEAPSSGSVSVQLGPAPVGLYTLWVNFSGDVSATWSTGVRVGVMSVSVDIPESPALGEPCEVVIASSILVGEGVFPYPWARVVFEVLMGGEILQRESFRTGPDGEYRMLWSPPQGSSVGDVLTVRAFSVDPPSPAWEGHVLVAPPGGGPRLRISDTEPLSGSEVRVSVDLGDAVAIHGPMNYLTYRLLHGDTPLLAGLSKNESFTFIVPGDFYGNSTLEVTLHFGGGVEIPLSARLRVRWCDLRILPPSGVVHPGTLEVEIDYSSPFPGDPRILVEVLVGGAGSSTVTGAPGRLDIDIPEGAGRVVVRATAYLSGRSESVVAEYSVASPPPQFSVVSTSLIPGVVTPGDRLWLVLGSRGYYPFSLLLNGSQVGGGLISGPAVRELEVPGNSTGVLTVCVADSSWSLYLVPGRMEVEARQRAKLLEVSVTGAPGEEVRLLVYASGPGAPQLLTARPRNGTLKVEIEASGARLVVAYAVGGGRILDAGAAYVAPYSRLMYEIMYAAGGLLVLIAVLWWIIERRGP